jgi:hypothetical protein
MPVYSQFLGKRKHLGDSADVLVECRILINCCNMLREISIMSHFTYQRMFGNISLQLKISITLNIKYIKIRANIFTCIA